MEKTKTPSINVVIARLQTIKRLAVIAMFSDDILMERLVLKGGSALDLVHGITTRASVDVDLSMSNDFDPAEYSGIPNRVERVLSSTYRPAGYEVIDVKMILKPPGLTADVADFWGGYEIQFKLVEQTVGLTHLWWTV